MADGPGPDHTKWVATLPAFMLNGAERDSPMMEWPSLPGVSELLAMARGPSPGAGGKGVSARFADMLAELAPRGPASSVVKVAGTNGKGSVCAMLEVALLRDGRRVGLFTSPHLVSPAERFRVDGLDVAGEVLDRHAAAIAREVAATITARGEAWRPSFFEMLVLVSARIFREAGVEVAIYEAGVGGYNDATHLLAEDVAVITSVALDHQDRLGNTVEEIASDKAGIASDGAVLVLGPGVGEAARAVIERDAARRGVHLVEAPRLAGSQAAEVGVRGSLAGLAAAQASVPGERGRVTVRLPLLGAHQVENLAVVVAALGCLRDKGIVRDRDCVVGVADARWAGRMEVLAGDGDGPAVVLDVAHNEHGIAALAAALAGVPWERRVIVYGASADKDFAACVPHLPAMGAEVHVVSGFHRAAPAEVIAAALRRAVAAREAPRIVEHAELDGALDAVRAMRGKVVVITGSVFLVGAARARLVAGGSAR